MVPRFPWLTPRSIIFGTFLWLLLFSLGSIAVANPFFDEKTATSSIDYWHVMYLHGMLIGMVGITLLTTMAVFQLRWRHAWLLVPLGVIAATFFDTIGGIFDHNIPGNAGDRVATWVQILGFFALDEMLIVIGWAFFHDSACRDRSIPTAELLRGVGRQRLNAGRGDHGSPGRLDPGVRQHALDHRLLCALRGRDRLDPGSPPRSRPIRTTWPWPSWSLSWPPLSASSPSEARRHSSCHYAGWACGWVSSGPSHSASMYVWAGFTSWVIPALFTDHNGANGVAADDLVTGFAMVGGLLALGGALMSRATRPLAPVLAATWGWMLTTGLVIVTGYWIEVHETHFGAGSSSAPGAASDAVFTWFHQDVGLFLFPVMAVVMLVTARYVLPKHQGPIAWTAIVGSTILFVGGMVYVFIDQALHGTGYVLSTIGLLVIGAAFLGTIWWGFGQGLFTARRSSSSASGAQATQTVPASGP